MLLDRETAVSMSTLSVSCIVVELSYSCSDPVKWEAVEVEGAWTMATCSSIFGIEFGLSRCQRSSKSLLP